MIVGHNEYWSLPMYRAAENFMRGGGNLLVLSGNTLGWRVSFNDDCTIMECRKVDAPGDQVPKSRRGEAWHSQDGLRGGAQRECGMPGYRVIGARHHRLEQSIEPEKLRPLRGRGRNAFPLQHAGKKRAEERRQIRLEHRWKIRHGQRARNGHPSFDLCCAANRTFA